METIFMSTEDSKTNKSNKFRDCFTDNLNLKSPNKTKYLLHLQEHKSTYKSSKFKISAPTWNDEFDLLGGSYSLSRAF